MLDKPGTPVWVPHPELAWVHGAIAKAPGLIKKSKHGKPQVHVKTDSGEKISVETEKCELDVGMNTNLALIEDLTKLPALHEPALLQSLTQRFEKEHMYTYTGRILIAINPFKNLGIYGDKQMKRYINAPLGAELPPHAYAVADAAYKKMVDEKGRNQSILVSGESGAGKTETTKIVMEYLTEISSLGGKKSDRKISAKILQANPLLEAFGNAKTLRNDNSSRFGKLIKMQFEQAKRSLNGAQITTYLLEKARVAQQGDGERNYHIFYEMFAGGTSEQKKRWNLPPVSDCHYTNQSRTTERDDVDDKEQFKATLNAMDILNFTQQERDDVFNTVAAILHLGNIEFDSSHSHGQEGCSISSATKESAAMCAKLLGVDKDALERVLCSRVLRVGPMMSKHNSEVVMKGQTCQQASDARDALAMTLYERLFGWIVWRTNSAIGGSLANQKSRSSQNTTKSLTSLKFWGASKQDSSKNDLDHDSVIGCLDVFGFEVFEKNSFEQFCINYCNEQLQRQFNEFVFEIEQEEYEQEGIDWTYVSYPDNSACIEMIESRPIGLLSLIDEECMYPAGNDESLVKKLYQHLPKRFPAFKADQRNQVRRTFVVSHFAGDVVYTCEGFYQKNKNELRQESVDLIVSSNDSLVSILLPPDAESAAGGADMADYFAAVSGAPKKKPTHRSNNSSRSSLQQKTVGSHFRSQLKNAMSTIRASEPHYIRCLKPNDHAIPLEIDPVRLVEQLRYSGVIEVIRVARAGYPSRFKFADFVDHFSILGLRPSKGKSAAFEANKLIKSGNTKKLRAVCEEIVKGANVKYGEDYQIGVNKVFMRADTFTTLQLQKNAKIKRSVVKIQRAYRAYAWTTKRDRAATKIQAVARAMRVRNLNVLGSLMEERKVRLEKEAKNRKQAEAERIKKQKQAEAAKIKKQKEAEAKKAKSSKATKQPEPESDFEYSEMSEYEMDDDTQLRTKSSKKTWISTTLSEVGVSEVGKYMIIFVGLPLILNSIASNPSLVLSMLILLFGMILYIMQDPDDEFEFEYDDINSLADDAEESEVEYEAFPPKYTVHELPVRAAKSRKVSINRKLARKSTASMLPKSVPPGARTLRKLRQIKEQENKRRASANMFSAANPMYQDDDEDDLSDDSFDTSDYASETRERPPLPPRPSRTSTDLDSSLRSSKKKSSGLFSRKSSSGSSRRKHRASRIQTRSSRFPGIEVE